MDIKKQVFNNIIEHYNTMFYFEKDLITKAAEIIKDCVEHRGVVQVCGVGHAVEFANELNYRAGGIAPVHAINPDELYVKGVLCEEEYDDFYNKSKNIDIIRENFILDDRDIFVLVSNTGGEPLLLEIARQAKKNFQKVIVVLNRNNTQIQKGSILEYCDLVLDACAEEKDFVIDVNGLPIGRYWTTVCNVLAQMITAEVYHLYSEEGKKCPVLLSANLKDADIHNNALTDIYGKRVRG